MIVLPLIDRELRVAARRPAVHRVRLLSALIVSLIWLFLFVVGSRASTAALSRELFTAVGVLALSVSLLAGVFLTSDCLSQEKREGTIGLLFLTDLKAYDIVLAKVVSSSIQSIYGLLAVFPVFGLSLLMGGVSPGEFCRVTLVVLSTLVLSIALGTCASAISREARQAMTRTVLGLLVLAGILPALWWVWFGLSGKGGWDLLLWPSPVFTFRSAFDSFYRARPGPQDFWVSLLLVGLLGAGFLALAVALLPRTWHDPGPRAENLLDTPVPRNSLADRPGRAGDRTRLLETDPGAWLALRQASFRKIGLRWHGVLVGLWFCFLAASILGKNSKESFIGCLFTTIALHWAVKYSVAVEATRQLSVDQQSGALELLLSTPLRETDILRGLARAIRLQFRGLVILVTSLNFALCGVVVVFGKRLQMATSDQELFLILFCGGILALWFDFMTLSVTGRWMALRARRHNRAILASLGRVMLVPWAGLMLMVFLMSQNRAFSTQQITLLFTSWFGLGLVNDLIIAARAWAGLRRGMRAYLLGAEARSGTPRGLAAGRSGPGSPPNGVGRHSGVGCHP